MCSQNHDDRNHIVTVSSLLKSFQNGCNCLVNTGLKEDNYFVSYQFHRKWTTLKIFDCQQTRSDRPESFMVVFLTVSPPTYSIYSDSTPAVVRLFSSVLSKARRIFLSCQRVRRRTECHQARTMITVLIIRQECTGLKLTTRSPACRLACTDACCVDWCWASSVRRCESKLHHLLCNPLETGNDRFFKIWVYILLKDKQCAYFEGYWFKS